jgi:hypothetical protein
MNLTGAINVIVLTILVDAERYDGFRDINGDESPRRKIANVRVAPTTNTGRSHNDANGQNRTRVAIWAVLSCSR